jgi:tetratricopeptide (TPR) repeat protein
MAKDDERAKLSAPDAAALAAALADSGNSAARDYLRAQTRLADLQSEDLKREDRLRHWSLRVRHISDVLKLGFEMAVAFIVLAFAVGLGAAIWSATQADGLVIQSFAVPASMAAHGLSGEVVADKLLDRLTIMQDATNSSRAASSFANDWTNDIKVAIPDTGVSFGEAVRYLHGALGHEMHLSGELYETAKGIALTVRLDNEPGQTFAGAPDDLDAVVQKASEAVFRRAQPYRFGMYLSENGRLAESLPVLRRLADGSGVDAAWANIALSFVAANADRNAEALALAWRAHALDPDFPNTYGALRNVDESLAHDENLLSDERNFDRLLPGPDAREWDQSLIAASQDFTHADIAQLQGDYRTAIADWTHPKRDLEFVVASTALDAASDHDSAAVADYVSRLRAMRDSPSDGPSAIRDAEAALAQQAVVREDWRGALARLDRAAALTQALEASTPPGSFFTSAQSEIRTFIGPLSATADAMLGEQAKSDAILKTLPPDCDICDRMRGRIDAARGNGNGAAYWFAIVAARSPDIPFADTDWGKMLLSKGDLDGAIAKFESANQKGPHFADPLELWGEALIAKNRSDLALAKFAEATNTRPTGAGCI